MKPVVGTKCFFLRNWHVFQNSSVTKPLSFWANKIVVLASGQLRFGFLQDEFQIPSLTLNPTIFGTTIIPACTQRTWLGKNSNFGAPQQLDSSGLCRATSVPKTKNSASFDPKDVKKWPQKTRWIIGDGQYCWWFRNPKANHLES